ncbi:MULTISPECIES: MarR family winged helix-turn-helix transcriptional regulator [Arthrobacter]|uniref:MarR family winged helix-turn-helix transcriptional regulator n=1 Tax=unclassified Arthrobacter TaxID=235627 RepID=UPI0024B9D7F6|nr:MarR family winged helix-turn-helix transcriptional regulator [Arthrobacter sp. H35-MC1]
MNRVNEQCESPPSLPDSDQHMIDAIADVEKQFGTMVIRTRNAIRKRAAAIHPELQPTGFKVLTILSQLGPSQQVTLAEEMGVDKALMSRTVKHLEVLKLVHRTADPDDGRAMLVAMTEETHTRYSASLANTRRVLYDRLSTWDPVEVRRFADLLGRLNENAD